MNDDADHALHEEPTDSLLRGEASTGSSWPEDGQSCLLFTGLDSASSGRYRPQAYQLQLRGENVAQHHITHLHEIHHKVLNDDTPWGSLIHIAARHPGWEDLLAQLVGGARIVHEAFASFMSTSLAQQRHIDVALLLEEYPAYLPLVDRMQRLLAPVPAGHRQDLAATGIARFCMSAPVLQLAADRYPERITLADIPSAWLPDQRFAIITGARAGSVEQARAAADARFAEDQGRVFDMLGLDETDERLDSAWAVWESTFVEELRAAEPRVGALPHIGANQHLPAAASLARMAFQRGISLPLPHESEITTISDAESVQRLLTATEIVLRSAPAPSVLAELGRDVDTEAVLGLSAAGSRPFLVIHGRRAAQMSAAFELGPQDVVALEHADEPVFAVRLLIDDRGRDLILNAIVPTPEACRGLLAAWPDDEVVASCITTSCFVSTEWQRRWQPVLASAPAVLLLDMGLSGMVGAGRLLDDSSAVHGIYVGLADPTLKALAWHVEGHPHVMLALGDDLTVQLVAGQLEDFLGDRLRMRDSDWSAWLSTLSAVCASVLATEHVLRYDGPGRM